MFGGRGGAPLHDGVAEGATPPAGAAANTSSDATADSRAVLRPLRVRLIARE